MRLYSENEYYKLYQGSMLDMLEVIDKKSIDSIITDPPYELNFMNKGWDNSGIAFQKETWKRCFEVLKPGGYLLAFGGSRTFHRIACAIEDAGFEIRDTIMWLYGSGFPKSQNIGKMYDKKMGNDREIIGETKIGKTSLGDGSGWDTSQNMKDIKASGKIDITKGSSKFEGWGSALKPSYEPIIVARKPFKGSLVDNVIEYGVGGINIDECRVEGTQEYLNGKGNETIKEYNNNIYQFNSNKLHIRGNPNKLGRFPANTILTYDETDFDEVCGGFPNTKPAGNKIGQEVNKNLNYNASSYKLSNNKCPKIAGDNGGSASRYFMNCKYTGKDEEIWKQLFVSNVESNLEILKATKDNIVQMNVEDLLKELKDHYAKYVDNQLDLIEIPIVQDIAKMLTWDFKIGTSQVIQDFIINSKKCIQFLNLVQFVEKMDNIDTTQITQNLLKLFGYVKVVITNYIQGNIEYDQKRYIYTPKASKKDRDEGLKDFEDGNITDGRKAISDRPYLRKETPRKNIHPTVKPTELMQYLVRLVNPDGSTILDPFNGSGSTGKAVMYENKERNKNYKYIGIELTEEYLPISKARIEYVCNLEPEVDNQTNIFEFIGE